VSLYFLDSSALVKRYVTETGSSWIRDLTDPGARNPLIIARITWVEVLSALARREREGSLTPDDVTQAIRAFRYDLNMQYQVSEIDPALTKTAGDFRPASTTRLRCGATGISAPGAIGPDSDRSPGLDLSDGRRSLACHRPGRGVAYR
jgi:hypothetical protein